MTHTDSTGYESASWHSACLVFFRFLQYKERVSQLNSFINLLCTMDFGRAVIEDS
jgi:hypothetical protein